jgi:hypothetical protein
MGFLGKKKIKEIEAAGQFVMAIMRGVQEYWPSVAQELNQLFQSDEAISEDQHAGFEFSLAVISSQIQALPNLLNKQQADRIREYILQCISSPELGSYPRDAIEDYQTAWDASLKEGEPPFYGISAVLFDKLGCEDSVEIGGNRFKDPLLLMALSEKVVTFGGPWWKNMLQEYEIVP